MKRVGCSLIVVALAGISLAQVSSTPAAIQLNTVYAGADGKFEAAPDTVVVRMDIASQQDTSRAAYDHVALAVDHVRQVLKTNGIDLKAAQFGTYQMQPMYDWKDPKHKVIGYRVTSDVTLKLRDFTKIGALTEQLANVEDTQNQSVNYTLEDIEQAKAKASEDALKKARNQAGAVATAGGRTLGELLYASVDVNQTNIVPMMYAQAGMARGAAPMATPPPMADFTPQTVTINAHVNALFALK
ncbi:MAG TPA: SIMPL domain-containing protein [Candidatus Angelobacter sp.]|nr:SIMPL domain-containing protein [Candidatus Angelobacter sp.]